MKSKLELAAEEYVQSIPEMIQDYEKFEEAIFTCNQIKYSYLAGAAKQRELDAEKIKDYEQALKFYANKTKLDCGELAYVILKKWGDL